MLFDANSVISAEDLIDRIWEERPPREPRQVLYSYVSRLRKVLAPADPDVRIVGRAGAYVLTVDPAAVDMHRFRDLCNRARAVGNEEEAESTFNEAIAEWRGPALPGLDTFWATAARQRLDRERVAAEVARNILALRHGHAAELLPVLATSTLAYPLDETFAGQLMLALYQTGRQAEALEHFRQLSRRLEEEAVQPQASLHGLYRRILNADPALLPSRADQIYSAAATPDRLQMITPVDDPFHQPAERPRAVATEGELPPDAASMIYTAKKAPDPIEAPAELPPLVYGFVGRSEELAALDQVLDGNGSAVPAVVISALAGAGGVGKTALALRWAHSKLNSYPDGQLYVDLHGFDSEDPLHPDDVLARFLVALGGPGSEVPYEHEAKQARYRSLLVGKRVLVVLDNAVDSAQVRPLLPGSSTCRVLVTSRNSLAGLVARDGARRIDLDVLPLPDACQLLRVLLGERVGPHEQPISDLAERCGRSPLAIRIAAERMVSRPELVVSNLIDELRDERRLLDTLQADEHTAVRTVFSWSLRRLAPDLVGFFRALGLHPGFHIDPYAAAAMIDAIPRESRSKIDMLRRLYLVQPAGAERVCMHDLVRAYAADLAEREDDEDLRRATLARLFGYYLHAAGAAMDAFLPGSASRRRSTSITRFEIPPMLSPADGSSWLQTEKSNLVALSGYAVRHGSSEYAIAISDTIWNYLHTYNHDHHDARVVHENALEAARAVGDMAAEAAALANLGRMYTQWDRHTEALNYLDRALEIVRAIGDRFASAGVARSVGWLYTKLGRFDEAGELLHESIDITREFGDRYGEAQATTDLVSRSAGSVMSCGSLNGYGAG
jgi:DNA-binding SARP family transcriptional activator